MWDKYYQRPITKKKKINKTSETTTSVDNGFLSGLRSKYTINSSRKKQFSLKGVPAYYGNNRQLIPRLNFPNNSSRKLLQNWERIILSLTQKCKTIILINQDSYKI